MRLQLQVYLPGRSGGASVRNTAPQELPAGIWTDVEATLPPGPSTKIAQTVVNVAGPPIDDFPKMIGSSLKKVLPSAGESALNEEGAIAGSACPSLRPGGWTQMGQSSVADECRERLRRWLRRRPSQLGDELDARCGERVGHRLLRKQAAKPPERCPLEP